MKQQTMVKRIRRGTKKLGLALLEAGIITEQELSCALSEHKKTGSKLGKALIELGYSNEKEIVHTLANNMGFDSVELHKVTKKYISK